MAGESNKKRRESNAAAARQKAAEAKAAQRRADQRRTALQVIGGIVAVFVLVAVVVVVALNHHSKTDSAAPVPADPAVVSGITSVTPATINTVGKGSSTTLVGSISGTPSTVDGKPDFMYIGGEFCPFCAAERWSMIQALSRFGTFTGLQQIQSSEDDLPTFTFVKATYTSKYVSFTPIELVDQNHNPLDKISDAQSAIFKQYSPHGYFPFLYFGGKFAQSGAGYNPELISGKTHAQISSALNDPTNAVTAGIVGEANNLTAAICGMTDNKPATVCSQSAVTNAKASIAPYDVSKA